MTPERWQQIDQLFQAAIACDPAQRDEFLTVKCAGDDLLRREVASLLASLEETDGFMETPAGDVAAELLGTHHSTFEPGHQIQNYRIVSQLGSGGMGEVYLAEDIRLKRKVALKLLPPHFTVNPDRVRRFEREARAASALNHPNIVTIYEIGQSNSTHFIATEFVDGKTLRQLINEKPFTLNETLNVSIRVAEALSGAHAAGIVHRDIKPENIMIRQDGYVKVLDFGLAKLTEQQTNESDLETPTLLQSNPGLVMGTVQYMSPEQARAKNVGVRTDIWSLGIVMYELLAGQVPFSGETPSHVMVSLMEDKLAPLRDHAIIPEEYDRFVAKALRKNQKERYQTADQLARDLKGLKQKLQLDSRLNEWLETVPSRKDGVQMPSLAQLTTSSEAQHETRAGAETLAVQSHPTSNVEFFVSKVRRHKHSFLLAAATLMIVIIVGVYFLAGRNSNGANTDSIDSVAVLPFANVSNDENTEYLTDGISDSIINSLSQLPGLKRVMSFTTVARYKGKEVDPQTVGRELNVRAVMIGKLLLRGDDLLISAELVDVKDNRRLWADQYNCKLADIVRLQGEIAQEIAGGLRLKLTGEQEEQLAKYYTDSTEAYRAYLLGRYFLERRTPGASEKSIEYLEEAVRLDPNYGLAYATLANCYLGSQGRFRDKAKQAVGKALAVDNTLAEAHAALGNIRLLERDWSGAERSFIRARELNPNYRRVHLDYAHYLRLMKRFEESVAESKRVLDIDPLSVLYNRQVAVALYFARRYDEAIEQSLKTVELEPGMPTAYRWLGKSYEQKGLYDQAVESLLKTQQFTNHGPETIAALREAYASSGWKDFWQKALDFRKARAKQRNIDPYELAENYVRLGDKDQAFYWLERAYEQNNISLLMWLNCDPFWDPLRTDPRYTDLVRRMGLEP